MAIFHRSESPKNEVPCERAIQLRREAIAAMKLRSASTVRYVNGSRIPESGPVRVTRQTRILAISDYEGLRSSREQVLRLEGFHVESASSRAVFEDSWVRSFDIAILCQSVEPDRAVRIAVLLRQANPCIALMRVNPSQASTEPQSLFDCEMDALAGPLGLLKAIEAIGQRAGDR
jgi:hypothetical protein